MRKLAIVCLVLASLAFACKRAVPTPRPTIPLVERIAADTTGLYRVAATAGHQGGHAAIALLGEPSDVIRLARHLQHVDALDNIDARAAKDSLPDFAGEEFQAILDVTNAPYAHFLGQNPDQESLDSLREAAVRNALFAWDSTCYTRATDKAASLQKSRSKVLIYTSFLQEQFGLFDVDTLQQLTGGASFLLSPARTLLEDAIRQGAVHIAVWAPRAVRQSEVFPNVYQELGGTGTVTVLTPDAALDVRTELRNLLRQYRTTEQPLDALILCDYHPDLASLASEIALIRQSTSDQDRAYNQLLSPSFFFLDPCTSLTAATYKLLRRENLFAHRISLPQVRYYETAESLSGESVLEEASSRYVQSAYVSDFD